MDFKAFDTRKIDAYAAEAKAAYGHTAQYREFEEKSKGRTAEETQQINQQMMQVFTEFGSMRQLSPEAERAQKQVKKLQAFITKNFYTCSDEILYGLAKMYAGGGAFTETIDTAGGSGTAEFVYQAVKRYCGK